MREPDVARNLLFGSLALQLDFVPFGRFVEAFDVWQGDKSKPLGQILLDREGLDRDSHALLERLVQWHLGSHGGDAEKCLAAIRSAGSAYEYLRRLGDAEVHAVLDRVSAVVGVVESTTRMSADSSAPSGRRFRMLGLLGKGGMGVVHEAIEEELDRKVAYKELKPQYADDPDCQSRLVFEAKITGRLDHPSIVPVYTLGKDAEGRPFYAMRLIRDKSLGEHIKRFHDAEASGCGSPESTREFRRLLGCFVHVCKAMYYAHRQGVIHRDLKPRNIMLGRYDETQVVDWGLARPVGRPKGHKDLAQETLPSTLPGGHAAAPPGRADGTPEYMSPEQAEGRNDELTPASDVYSLGATLYCLLTGRPPFRGDDRAQILQQVAQGAFPRPRRIKPSVPAALESVCLKAMALRPEDRYASAKALADDIEDWLADEPVSVHRETRAERARRWMRRHKTWTQAGVVALLSVVIVAIAATLIVNQARQTAIRLAIDNDVLAQNERLARQEALSRFLEARSAVDTWLTEAAEVLRYYPRAQEARKHLLQKAAEDYQRFAEQSSSDVDLELERGRTWLRLGDVRRILGESKEAEQTYRTAESLLAELSQGRPDVDDYSLELANSRTKLGLLLADLGRNDEAHQAYATAISQLDELTKVHPDEPRFHDALGTSRLNRGVLLAATGSEGQAEETLGQAIRSFEQLAGAEPKEPRYQAGLSTARIVLGQVLAGGGRHGEALAEIKKAISAFDALARQGFRRIEHIESRASARIYLAGVLRKMGRYGEELEAYQQAAGDYEALMKALPDLPLYKENLALTWTDLGNLLHESGRAAEAEVELSRALPTFSQLVVDYPQIPRHREQQATCRDVLGQALSDLGRHKEAKSAHELAAAAYQELVGAFPDVPQYRERRAVSQSHLGLVLHKLGDVATAREAHRAAIGMLEDLTRDASNVPSYRNELAFVCNHLGILCQETGDLLEAAKQFRRARELWQALASKSPAPEYCHNLAWLLVHCPDPQIRDPKQAIESAKRAKDQSPENASYWSTLGAAHYRTGDWQASITALSEAVRLRPDGHGRDGFFMAMAQKQLGKPQEALKSWQLACQWMDRNCPDNLELKRIRKETASLLNLPDHQKSARP